MRTLDTHLVGVTADAPHPESYRPDLPLNNEPSDAYRQGYDTGHREGYNEGVAEEDEAVYARGHEAGYIEGERDGIAAERRRVASTEKPA